MYIQYVIIIIQNSDKANPRKRGKHTLFDLLLDKHRMMHLNLKWKIVFNAILSAAVMAGLLVYFLAHDYFTELDQQFNLNVQQTTAQVASELESSLEPEDNENLKRKLQDLVRNYKLAGIEISNLPGEIQAAAGTGNFDPADTVNIASTYTTVRRQTMPHNGNATTSTIVTDIYTYFSKASLNRKKSEYLKRSFFIIGLGISASLLLGIGFYRLISNPIRRLQTMVQKIGLSRFDMQLQAKGDDEISRLAKEINSMTTIFHDVQDNMQEKIEQATEKLQETLVNMEVQNKELNLANFKALEAIRIKSDFMANMSHEIRTPMNGIIGFSNLLLRSNLNDEQKEYTQTIKTSATNLLAIINDILDFSRMESGDLHVENIDINLREVIEDVICYIAPSAYEKGLELNLMFYDDVPENITSDPVRIRQVVSNLIGNAIKFTKTGQITARVMLEDENDRDCTINISIEDTGIGLSLKDQRKLFTAFSQADTTTTRKFGGAGIGLVISKKVAEQMQGTIGLHSKLALGSTFWFNFKCRKQSMPAMVPMQDALSGTRCLLYDRNDKARNSILHHLRNWNVEVTETSSPENVSSLANAAKNDGRAFQYIVLGLSNAEVIDQDLPKILENIVDEHRYVFITLINSTNKESIDLCYRMGTDVCLSKSVRKRELYQHLCENLPKHLKSTSTQDTAKATLSIPPYDLSALKMLVVDDNRINRKLVTTILEQANAQVYEAMNGNEAVSQSSANYFDLIFMDIHMPELNGIDATRIIRTNEHSGRRCPIIALTANAVHGERERLIRNGLDGCLIKPIQDQELWSTIAKWIDPAKLRPMRLHIKPDSLNVSPTPRGLAYTQKALKHIQKDKAAEYAGGNPNLADELYHMFIEDLPGMKERLLASYESMDIGRIEEEAHKIHGAASCCAVQEIKEAAYLLEKCAIRKRQADIPDTFNELIIRIDKLLSSKQIA